MFLATTAASSVCSPSKSPVGPVAIRALTTDIALAAIAVGLGALMLMQAHGVVQLDLFSAIGAIGVKHAFFTGSTAVALVGVNLVVLALLQARQAPEPAAPQAQVTRQDDGQNAPERDHISPFTDPLAGTHVSGGALGDISGGSAAFPAATPGVPLRGLEAWLDRRNDSRGDEISERSLPQPPKGREGPRTPRSTRSTRPLSNVFTPVAPPPPPVVAPVSEGVLLMIDTSVLEERRGGLRPAEGEAAVEIAEARAGKPTIPRLKRNAVQLLLARVGRGGLGVGFVEGIDDFLGRWADAGATKLDQIDCSEVDEDGSDYGFDDSDNFWDEIPGLLKRHFLEMQRTVDGDDSLTRADAVAQYKLDKTEGGVDDAIARYHDSQSASREARHAATAADAAASAAKAEAEAAALTTPQARFERAIRFPKRLRGLECTLPGMKPNWGPYDQHFIREALKQTQRFSEVSDPFIPFQALFSVAVDQYAAIAATAGGLGAVDVKILDDFEKQCSQLWDVIEDIVTHGENIDPTMLVAATT